MTEKILLPVLGALILSACVSTGDREQQDKKLVSALRFQPVQRAEYALSQGASPDAKDASGVPVLIRAAALQKQEHVKLLLDAGADVEARDPEGETAIFAAVSGKNPEIVRMLLDGKADVNVRGRLGRTPLMEAARLGRLQFVRMLLEAGADGNMTGDRGGSAASYAAASPENGVEILKLLSEKGFSFRNADTRAFVSPFLTALFYQQTDTALYLLGTMPDFDKDPSFDPAGQVGIRYAIAHNQMPVVKAIAAKKLNLNFKLPLLFRGARLINVEGVYKFLSRNEVVDGGITPLMYACIYGRPEIAEFLIKSGADPFVESTEGKTAEDYANDAATAEVVQRLADEIRGRELNGVIEPQGLVRDTDDSIKRTKIF